MGLRLFNDNTILRYHIFKNDGKFAHPLDGKFMLLILFERDDNYMTVHTKDRIFINENICGVLNLVPGMYFIRVDKRYVWGSMMLPCSKPGD